MIVILLICCLLPFWKSKTQGKEWTDAEAFYKKYGRDAAFASTTKTDGNIYFASRGARTSSGICYRTIGWKMKVEDSNQKSLQTIYFVLDGDYLKIVQKKKTDSYQYNLYALKLSDAKKRMTSKSLTALNQGKATIVLDACMIVVDDGVAKGGMTDSGPSWGKVYTSYKGISGAQDWSKTSMKTLKTYFNKEVLELFYTVTLKGDPGVSTLSGAGSYCYGTTASLSVTTKTGYAFVSWSGNTTSKSASFSLVVGKNYSLTATTTAKKTKVTYLTKAGQTYTDTATYTYKASSNFYIESNRQIPGYSLLGWATSASAQQADFAQGETVKDSWIDRNYPETKLYGVLKENEYQFVFLDNNSVVGTVNVRYSGKLTMPKPSSDAGNFRGWQVDATGAQKLYGASAQESVAGLVGLAKAEYSNHARIVINAVRANFPTIEAGDIFLPLSLTKSGRVTAATLCKYAKAEDTLEGKLSLSIPDLNPSAIRSLKDRESLSITFRAVNKKGYETRKTVRLTAVDTSAKTSRGLADRIRFISAAYLDGDRGLASDSKWRTDPKCRELLNRALEEAD